MMSNAFRIIASNSLDSGVNFNREVKVGLCEMGQVMNKVFLAINNQCDEQL